MHKKILAEIFECTRLHKISGLKSKNNIKMDPKNMFRDLA
jgi:hypothetical protein